VVGGMTSASGPCRMTSCRKPHTDGACKADEVEAEDSTECPLCATDVLAKAGYADARSPRGDVGEHSLPCDSVLCEGQRSSIGVRGASSTANAEALVTGTRHAPPAPADGSSAESGAMALRSRALRAR
jgi:hypothetical protein